MTTPGDPWQQSNVQFVTSASPQQPQWVLVPNSPPDPSRRPGVAVAAAVLAYIQAAVVTVVSLVLAVDGAERALPFPLVVSLLQLASVAALVTGGVLISAARGRTTLLLATASQVVFGIAWTVWAASVGAGADRVLGGPRTTPAEAGGMDPDSFVPLTFGLVAFAFAILPCVSFGLSLAPSVKRAIAAKRQLIGGQHGNRAQ